MKETHPGRRRRKATHPVDDTLHTSRRAEQRGQHPRQREGAPHQRHQGHTQLRVTPRAVEERPQDSAHPQRPQHELPRSRLHTSRGLVDGEPAHAEVAHGGGHAQPPHGGGGGEQLVRGHGGGVWVRGIAPQLRCTPTHTSVHTHTHTSVHTHTHSGAHTHTHTHTHTHGGVSASPTRIAIRSIHIIQITVWGCLPA